MFPPHLTVNQALLLRLSNFQRIWSRSTWGIDGKTSAKPKIPLAKSTPRPYMHRLFEAVSEPILASDAQFVLQKPASLRCARPAHDQEQAERLAELTPRQLAYGNYLRKHLSQAAVVILCHEHPTDAKTQHYDIMELASNGVAFARLQEAKVMRSALHGTTLEYLSTFFDDDVESFTSLMYVKRYVKEEDDGRSDVVSGKVRDGNYLPVALRYAKSTNWVLPLAAIYEGRVLTMSEAEEFSSMIQNPLRVRAETVALLNSPMVEIRRILNEHALSLTSSLQSREEQLKTNVEPTAAKQD